MISVRSTMATPPGGLWFWSDRDHFVAGPDFDNTVFRLAALFRALGRPDDPKQALFEYMCPRMPPGFCTGDVPGRTPTMYEYLDRGHPYFKRQLVTADEIDRRLSVCLKCPKHAQTGCLHCLGIDEQVYLRFGGNRAILPIDRKSGVCSCAGTLEMTVASVKYDASEGKWEGTPDGCWRNT